MTFNSEITIINNTPERGRITGKRVRLSGTTGKLHAIVNHGYVFKHWIDTATGQIISTNNPLVITSWEAKTIEPVFDHLLLDTAFYEERDALETETFNLERGGYNDWDKYITEGVNNVHYGDIRGMASAQRYYTQGVRNFVQTRTNDIGITYQTRAHNWGYGYVTNQPRSTPLEFDPVTNTSPTGHNFQRKPWDYSEPPLSGVPAEKYLIRSEIGMVTRGYVSTYVARARGASDNSDANSNSTDTNPYWGVRNNPTVGPSTQFPMLEYTRVGMLYTGDGWHEDFDSAGMEAVTQLTSLISYPYNYKVGTQDNTGSTVRNLDGLINNAKMNYVHLTEPVAGGKHRETLYDRTKPGPRLYEVFGYYPQLRTVYLRNKHKYRDDIDILTTNSLAQVYDTKFHTASSAEWVSQYQEVPSSGSVLYNLRYTKANIVHFKWHNITDFSVYRRYGKSMHGLMMTEPWYNAVDTSKRWQTPDFSDLTAMKNLKALYIYGNSKPCYEGSIMNWQGLKDCKSLKHVYIYGDSKLTENIKYSYIPESVKFIYIYPPPLPTTANPYENEKVIGSFTADTVSGGLSSLGRHQVHVINNQTTVETIT